MAFQTYPVQPRKLLQVVQSGHNRRHNKSLPLWLVKSSGSAAVAESAHLPSAAEIPERLAVVSRQAEAGSRITDQAGTGSAPAPGVLTQCAAPRIRTGPAQSATGQFRATIFSGTQLLISLSNRICSAVGLSCTIPQTGPTCKTEPSGRSPGGVRRGWMAALCVESMG